jgi:hypothetical protein
MSKRRTTDESTISNGLPNSPDTYIFPRFFHKKMQHENLPDDLHGNPSCRSTQRADFHVFVLRICYRHVRVTLAEALVNLQWTRDHAR